MRRFVDGGWAVVRFPLRGNLQSLKIERLQHAAGANGTIRVRQSMSAAPSAGASASPALCRRSPPYRVHIERGNFMLRGNLPVIFVHFVSTQHGYSVFLFGFTGVQGNLAAAGSRQPQDAATSIRKLVTRPSRVTDPSLLNSEISAAPAPRTPRGRRPTPFSPNAGKTSDAGFVIPRPWPPFR